jgi:pyridoxamine 5'-phosphate oxidase
MISGVNHITLAVSDLRRSIEFYVGVLGFRMAAQWARGAYLTSGDAWLALSLDTRRKPQHRQDETHVAFSVSHSGFRRIEQALRDARVTEWRDNRSEGQSIYFLDPDGHKFEIHVGTLASRLSLLGVTDHADAPALPGQQRFVVRPLNRGDLLPDPIKQFQAWLEDAVDRGVSDPFAMTLSTVDSGDLPDARTVLLKAIDQRGFIFTSRHDSPKASHLLGTPFAAVTFYWPDVGRQVRARGSVERLADAESDAMYQARPRPTQLALSVLNQSTPVPDRDAIDREAATIDQMHSDEPLPRPEWGGYAMSPNEIEFWQGRSNRLHDRFRYARSNDSAWRIERLAP